jgi:hypothetical protein
LRGILPHVHIHDLEHRAKEYHGNMFIRSFWTDIPLTITRGFFEQYIGRPYENLATFMELLKAVKCANTEERTDNIFCSELAALFYKHAGIISPDIQTNNVIPEAFSVGAEEHDLLKGKALMDFPLKVKYDIAQSKRYGRQYGKLFEELK